MSKPIAVRTAEELTALGRGTLFTMRLTKAMSWRDLHRAFYYTANRQVTLTMRDGSVIVGRLDETPGYFAQDRRVWLRVEGRKTRKGVAMADVARLQGFKAPTLAEAYTALIGVTAGNPSPELAAEARSIIADM